MNSRYKYLILNCETHYSTLCKSSKTHNYVLPLPAHVLTMEKKTLELCLETGEVIVYDKEEYVFNNDTNYTCNCNYFIRTIMETRRRISEE